jgi:hypothetical protein
MTEGFDPIGSLIESSRIYDENSQVVARFIYSYYSEMSEVEKGQKNRGAHRFSGDELNAEIEEQIKVYEKYWERNNDYWKPCSVGSDENFDPSNITRIEVLSDGDGSFVVHLTYEHEILGGNVLAYQVGTYDGLPKIENHYY